MPWRGQLCDSGGTCKAVGPCAPSIRTYTIRLTPLSACLLPA